MSSTTNANLVITTELLSKNLRAKETDFYEFSSSVKKFIKIQYGDKLVQQYDHSVAVIEQMKKDLNNLQEASEGSRDHLAKYYCFLRFMAGHFPNVGNQKINFVFSWKDSFTRTRITQGNIYYEQANVLFNLAVIEAQLAGNETRSTPESAKAAALHLQNAAGIFTAIKDDVNPKIHEKVTLDLTSDCLDALLNFVLAEAQQCIYESAVYKQMKNTNLAKLAYATSTLFENAQKQMSSTNCQQIFDRYTVGSCQMKQAFYEALSQYHLSLDNLTQMEIGKQICRLGRAKQLANSGFSYYVTNGLKGNIQTLLSILDKAIGIAEKDNQTVYHERVATLDKLDPLEKQILAKPTPMKSAEDLNVTDPFSQLIPITVLEAKGRYGDQLQQKVVPFFKSVRNNREKIRGDLARVGLPGSVMSADQEKQQGIPDKVFSQVYRITQIGGVNRLKELRKTLGEMSDETNLMCRKIAADLDKEEQEDRECRDQFGKGWSRLPSYQLTQKVRKDLDDYGGKVQMAQKADQLIDSKMDSMDSKFRIFSMKKDQLDAMIPSSGSASTTAMDTSGSVFLELKASLQELESCFAEEEKVEKDFKATMDSEQIEKELLHKQTNLDAAVKEKLDAHEKNFITPVLGIQKKEAELMQKIIQLNGQWTNQRGNKQSAKEKFVQDIFETINKYEEISSNLQEGIQFYTNVQDLVRKIKHRVEDFCFARRTEKQDLISNIQLQLSGSSSFGNDNMGRTFGQQSQAQQLPQQQQQQPLYGQQAQQLQQQQQQPLYGQQAQQLQQQQQPPNGQQPFYGYSTQYTQQQPQQQFYGGYSPQQKK